MFTLKVMHNLGWLGKVLSFLSDLHTSSNLHIAQDIFIQYMFILIVSSFLLHHFSSPHTTVLTLPRFSSCIFLPLWSRFAYKIIHKYIRERTSVFCQSLLWKPNIGNIYRCSSLCIFSSCIINNSYHLLLHDHTGTICLPCRLSFSLLASATSASFSRLRIYRPDSPTQFPKRHHQQNWLLPFSQTKADSTLNPCVTLKEWCCLDLILKEETSHGCTYNMTECWKKIPLVSLLTHRQFVWLFFSLIHPSTL